MTILFWKTTGFDCMEARGDRGLYVIVGIPGHHAVLMDNKQLALCATEDVARSMAQGFENRWPHVIGAVKMCYAALKEEYPFDD